MGTRPWLTIVGIGEDGVEGLPYTARAAIGAAALVVGGARHLALADRLIFGERRVWPRPLADIFPDILARRGSPVVVLASGDPFWFGVGSLLAEHVPTNEYLCISQPSAVSLACARLGWPLQDVATISFCGRPLEALRPLLQPGARILALSADGTTPAAVATLLSVWGFGQTQMTVLEAIGGPNEKTFIFNEQDQYSASINPLNLMALEVNEGPSLPLSAGLEDGWFETDGQITKQEIRALTIAALAPKQGECLWDIGAGSGAIGIEWMLRHPSNRAIAVEARADRVARIQRNALTLGVPDLEVWHDTALAVLDALPPPNAIFIGGGASDPAVTDACWAALPPGGRLVINAVTVATERVLLDRQEARGGRLTRIGIERLEPIGPMQGFVPARTVLQYRAVKP